MPATLSLHAYHHEILTAKAMALLSHRLCVTLLGQPILALLSHLVMELLHQLLALAVLYHIWHPSKAAKNPA